MTSPTLLVENLTIDYGGFRALDNLSFRASAGDVIGIIGPNGAGKTSFIKALCGRINFNNGYIRVNDIKLHNGRARQKLLGLVPQDIGLYAHMSAKENLEAFAKIMGLSRGKTRRESVQKALDAVDLTHKANTKVSKLSGGMKRRINVAAAIMHDPDVLILDEPTAGADIAARDTVHRLARQIANTGKVVLLVTHELDQAEALCDKLLILSNGKKLMFDTPTAIMSKAFPASREVLIKLISSPDTTMFKALAPFNFKQGDTPTEWLTMTNASEVSFVSAFMASLRGGNDLVREISVRRPGLSHLIKHIEKTGEFPSPTRSVITPNA